MTLTKTSTAHESGLLLYYLLSFVGRTVSNQYDILQKHRINLTDEEMSEFTELFKVINYLYLFLQGI